MMKYDQQDASRSVLPTRPATPAPVFRAVNPMACPSHPDAAPALSPGTVHNKFPTRLVPGKAANWEPGKKPPHPGHMVRNGLFDRPRFPQHRDITLRPLGVRIQRRNRPGSIMTHIKNPFNPCNASITTEFTSEFNVIVTEMKMYCLFTLCYA